jgi:hypothetical protein
VIDALGAIEALDRWARLQMARDLCQIMYRHRAGTEGRLARDVLLGLIRAEEPPLAAAGEALLDLAAGAAPKEIVGALDHASVLWLNEINPLSFGTRLDVTKVEYFAAPLLILAIAIVLAEENPGVLGVASDTMVRNLAALLDHALSGRYSRLAFLGALDLTLDVPELVD